MGVDARMFIKLKGRDKWLDEATVKRLSYEIGSTIGADNFGVALPGEWSWWPKGRRAIEIVEPVTLESIKEDYGEDFITDYPKAKDWIGKAVITQDGPAIIAEPHEQFLKVSLSGRYWGPNYERGSWPTIRAIIEWCRVKTGGDVWYGGDSSGICAEEMTQRRVDEFDRHFTDNGRRPYVRHESPFKLARPNSPPTCPPVRGEAR